MRAAAANPAYMRWATAMTERVSLPLSGYVWEENGRLVGNLTLIPFLSRRQRCYLIANVAVHPEYRRRGIAREMTVAAIQYARQRSAPSVWLHLREENEAAIQLYENLGFQERACRTTWYTPPPAANHLDQKIFHAQPEAELLRRETASLRLISRRSRHWAQQRQWLGRLYPPELTWHLAIRAGMLRPGLSGVIQRFFSNQWVQQWSAVQGDELLGVLTWQSTHSYADALLLATAPEYERDAAFVLLANARKRLPSRRALALDYPAHQAEEAIRAAGFHIHQTLIWMAISNGTGK
jgi:GNAT superfamily N-acetyltransferase